MTTLNRLFSIDFERGGETEKEPIFFQSFLVIYESVEFHEIWGLRYVNLASLLISFESNAPLFGPKCSGEFNFEASIQESILRT